MKPALLSTMLLAVVLSSCASTDPVTVQNTQSQPFKLVIKPDSVNDFLYKKFDFKARIDGMPSSDIRFDWDFGDGTYNSKSDYVKSEVSHSYGKAGDFILKVKGFDYFADTVIAENSISVKIAEPAPSVQLIPKNIDTVVSMDNSGGFVPKTFVVTVNTALSSSELIFNYKVNGPGVDTQYVNAFNYINFPILLEGPYIVITEVIRKSGGIYGRDTSVIMIKMPPVTLQMLQTSKNVTIKLNVDTSTAISHSPGFRNPLVIGLPFRMGVSNSYFWNGSSFSVYYFDDHTSGVKITDHILGSISSDFQSITEIKVTVDDATPTVTTKWGFTIKNLRLIAVTPTSIVYLAKDVTTAELISDIYFNLSHGDYSDCGEPKTIDVHIDLGNPLKLPNAIVIFSK